MLSLYQNLPAYINPIAFRIGFFSVRWYSIMYLVAFSVVYFLLAYRLKRKEYRGKLDDKKFLLNYLFYAFLGMIIGARIGHVLIYNLSYYISNSLEIFSPFNSQGEYVGIYGMSYFGGLAGAIIFSLIFIKKNRMNIWLFSDFIMPAIPAGYFFGRIGNFLNGELYGKITEMPWGIYFPGSINLTGEKILLRHPSQIYEALLEGLLLFLILWIFRNNLKWKGKLLGFYLLGYGVARFFCEFARETEDHLGPITVSQFLSVIIIIIGLIIWKKKKNIV